MEIQAATNPTAAIDRRDNLSSEEFLKEYALPGSPVVLSGIMASWKASTLWTKEFFKSSYGALQVIARNSEDYEETIVTRFDDYLDRLWSHEERAAYYLKDWVFENVMPELMTHYHLPAYLQSWTRWLPDLIRPKWRWLFIGPPNTASHLHVDFLNTSAWNALISGRKRWLFFSPDQAPYMYRGKVNAFHPDLERYPLFAKAKPMGCIQNPGEIVFTPSGWWHAVMNEDNSISISENFINETNIKNYFKAQTMFRFFRYADHPWWTG